MRGHICSPRVYLYKGILFEYHDYSGPWPLKKNGDPKKVVGKKFYDLWEEFAALSAEEQETYYESGGCITIE